MNTVNDQGQQSMTRHDPVIDRVMGTLGLAIGAAACRGALAQVAVAVAGLGRHLGCWGLADVYMFGGESIGNKIEAEIPLLEELGSTPLNCRRHLVHLFAYVFFSHYFPKSVTPYYGKWNAVQAHEIWTQHDSNADLCRALNGLAMAKGRPQLSWLRVECCMETRKVLAWVAKAPIPGSWAEGRPSMHSFLHSPRRAAVGVAVKPPDESFCRLEAASSSHCSSAHPCSFKQAPIFREGRLLNAENGWLA
ncbi:hypothetical protein B0H21DRAFT_880864 [Amylocystis lapponica]|nr:hypothetical protein B0H21DRAFT_880864 [Amylocystis lapponica]